MRPLKKGDVLVVEAHDHNGNDGTRGGNRVRFIGMFVGRTVVGHRRFLRLAIAVYPEGNGWAAIGRAMNIIESEVIAIRNFGRARL